MLKLLRKRKAQNTAEYAILIGLIVSAAVAMQVYVKRGVQGRVHDASNKFYTNLTTDANWSNITSTTATALGTGGQYEPTQLSSQSTQKTIGDNDTTGASITAGTSTGEKITYDTGGTVTKESARVTKHGIDDGTGKYDYQKYDY